MDTNEIRVLVGAPTRQTPEVLQAHIKTLKAQRLPPNVKVDYLWVDDNEDKESSAILLSEGNILEPPERPPDAKYAVGPSTHEWSTATFDHLARAKQALFEHAKSKRYDYIWIVDTDLLLDPGTFESLYYQKRPIISAVFWTQWTNGNDNSLGPNVWLRHPYTLSGLGLNQHEFLQKLADRQTFRVIGGGACILIHSAAFNRISYYPRIQGLPNDAMWQGEDRSFSIYAQRSHINQYADAWPDIFHAYHPQDRDAEVLEKASEVLGAERQEYAKYGDQVNFTLEALEEPALANETIPIRGRLGGINLLPQVEAALLDTRIGEEAIFEVYFPYWYAPVSLLNRPPEMYANTHKTIRLRLIDAKPYSYAPVLSEHMYRGLEI